MQSLVEFRKEHQKTIDRREYDLYDPDSKKKDLPARVSDEDPRMTVSGLQTFNGEDLMYEKRKKLQQEQMRCVKNGCPKKLCVNTPWSKQ